MEKIRKKIKAKFEQKTGKGKREEGNRKWEKWKKKKIIWERETSLNKKCEREMGERKGKQAKWKRGKRAIAGFKFTTSEVRGKPQAYWPSIK